MFTTLQRRKRGTPPPSSPDRPPLVGKRSKFFTKPCTIVDGIYSASKSAGVFNARNPPFSPVHVALETFFDGDQKDKKVAIDIDNQTFVDFLDNTYSVSSTVKKLLQDASFLTSEQRLRNAVYTDLMDNHGIQFPASSLAVSGVRKGLRRINSNISRRYDKTNLSSLMFEYANQHRGRTIEKSMERIMRGLPVTTTSLPDMCPLIDALDPEAENNALRVDRSTQLRLGEFKNAHEYTKINALAQVVYYLHGLLYFLRVELGEKVDRVYGFCVCGCKCRDQGSNTTYAVTLVRLCAPEILGETIKVEIFTLQRSTTDMLPMQLLVHFLKHGKRWKVSPNDSTISTDVQLTPSLFTLPTNLWENKTLVRHGTLSIVFHGTSQEISNILESFRDRDFPPWLQFKKRVFAFLQTEEQNDDRLYYLKMRSKDTDLRKSLIGAMTTTWHITSKRRAIAEVYPVEPFGDEVFGVLFMRDCGDQLSNSDFTSGGCGLFLPIIETVEFLNTVLLHGDVLPHNIVYNKQEEKFTLIDLDEGIGKESTFVIRNNTYTESPGEENDATNPNWHAALCYPNYLREKPVAYTKVQLIATFLVLMQEEADSDTALSALRKDAQSLGEELRLNDKNEMTVGSSDSYTKQTIDPLYDRMKEFVRARSY